MDYFPRHIREFANFLVLGEMSVRHAKVGNANLKGAARINIHDALNRHASMIFGHVPMGDYL